MKLVVNAYMSVLIEGVAEALELAAELGIDASELAEAIEGGPLDAPITDAKLHKMEQGDFAPEFPLEWALKDVDLAIAAAGWLRRVGHGSQDLLRWGLWSHAGPARTCGAVAVSICSPRAGSRGRAVADQGHRGLDRGQAATGPGGSHHDGRYADGPGLRVRGARHA